MHKNNKTDKCSSDHQRRPVPVDHQRERAKAAVLSNTMKLYYLFVGLGCVVLVVILAIQLGASGDGLRELSTQYAFRNDRIQAARGNILSDDGRILVTSIPLYEIRMDFAAPGFTDSIFFDNVVALSGALSDFFGDMSAGEYEEKLRMARSQGKRYFEIAPRRVNYVEMLRIRTFPLIELGVRRSGFIAIRTYNRVRPFDNIASRTIGFVNSDGVKVGLEGGFDDMLRGIEGLTVNQKISGNFWVPIQSNLNIEPIDGKDLRTTINIEMQDFVQSALREQVLSLEADWGTVVVMEVETGHIKAIANITQKRDGTLVEDYNYAVGMSQEPGSTFKLPVLMALMDKSNINLGTRFDTERGVVEIGEAKVVDTKYGGYGWINMLEVFGQSSNIGMAKAVNSAFEGRSSEFVDAIIDMGMGKELGLQIAGEPRPTVKHPRVRGSGWDGTSLTMMSYGYAIRVTPIQTLALYNAVANGGKLMRPLLVEALLEKGEVVRTFEPEVLNPQIATPQTINNAQKALEYVVTNGTAKVLRNSKYTVAAKTGTAQIAQGSSGYITSDGSRHYLGSVAGYFPANNPKYTMIVALKTYYEKGSDRTYYGGALAAPLFRSIADNIYSTSLDFVTPYRGGGGAVSSSSGRRLSGGSSRKVFDVSGGVAIPAAPSVLGRDFSSALSILEGRGFSVRSSGMGRVVSQRTFVDSVSMVPVVLLELSL